MVGPTGPGTSGVFRNWEDGPTGEFHAHQPADQGEPPIYARKSHGKEGLRLNEGRKSTKPNS